MTTAAIREKLINYMQVADDKKVKAIYTMVEDEINASENDWDDDFIEEMERRSKSFARDMNKSYSWEESKQQAIENVKAIKRKKDGVPN